ncbi:MAG: hypothetical protein PF439_05790 [Helicobacteraceae bacterium]|jgi:hypothetical protein|nr:hypothetical protein [Helicobacteraceae bacterium]
MKKTFLCCFLILFAGCSTISNVAPVGKDTYKVSSEMGGQFPSWSDVKGLSLKRANEYCRERGKYMVEGTWETHGSRGWTPLTAELTFQCLVDSPEK